MTEEETCPAQQRAEESQAEVLGDVQWLPEPTFSWAVSEENLWWEPDHRGLREGQHDGLCLALKFFSSAKDGTQGLIHLWQALYH
jgi:hypothetical protein